MTSKLSVAEGAFKPLTGVGLHSLSSQDRNSQDEHEMAVLGRAQELNVSSNNPILDRVYRTQLTHNSATSVLFQRWGLLAR